MAQPLLTAAEVAKRLQINVETVYLLIQKGELPAAKIGRQWRFDEAALTQWIQNRMQPQDMLDHSGKQ